MIYQDGESLIRWSVFSDTAASLSGANTDMQKKKVTSGLGNLGNFLEDGSFTF